MGPDATGSGNAREEALRAELSGHQEALAAKLDLIEAERDAGHLTPVQAASQTKAAWAAYDRDVSLAKITAVTGWETWVGVGGVLYARRRKASPPRVVRAPSVQALREAIENSQW